MKNNDFFTKRLLANLLVVAAGIILYLALSNFQEVGNTIGDFISVLSPFIAGIAIAFLLNIPMRFFENKVFKRFRRKQIMALLTTYVLVLLVMFLLVGMIVPQLIDSIATLVVNIQVYFDNINSIIVWLGDALELESETVDVVMGVLYRFGEPDSDVYTRCAAGGIQHDHARRHRHCQRTDGADRVCLHACGQVEANAAMPQVAVRGSAKASCRHIDARWTFIKWRFRQVHRWENH